MDGFSRRASRLRREYLFRKSLEGSERAAYEKKRKIQQALAEGKPLPTELRTESEKLRAESALEDATTELAVDDEYATYDGKPKIIVTTSRQPSSRLMKFAKEVRLLFPGASRANRGGRVLADIVEDAKAGGLTDVVIVHEHRGEPDGMIVSHLPHGPTAYFGLSSTVTRHDIRAAAQRAAAEGGGAGDDDDEQGLANVSEAVPHLIFDNFGTKLGLRVKNILQHLFPSGAKKDGKRVMTFSNQGEFVEFRHHTYTKGKGRGDSLTRTEAGPRFAMRLYKITQGTVDETEAESEFVLRPYLNSKKARRATLG